jgi:choline dehydrogenase
MTPTKLVSAAESFDYVVVGAGSAGCVVASRLTEDPSVRVLLLEAGPEDSVDAIRIPALFSTLFGTGVDWDYRIEPQAHYGGSELYPRGKTLGGSSAINLMVYIRGNRADFDGWSQQGCAGWDYDSVLPYFMKSETNSRHKAPLHGTDGPLHVEDRMFTHELSRRWIDAAAEWGLPRTDDFNGTRQVGAGTYQVTCHNGWRWSAADAYLKPVMDRPNLIVAVNSQASRILFDGGRATGVAYIRDGVEVHVRADAEVIISGGAINSPQLLLLSGIGPAEQLRSQGIPVQVDLPGVGSNLQDHVMTPIVWATKDSSDLLQLATPENLAVWQEGRGGPFTSNGSEVGGFSSVNGDTSPDVQFMGGPTSFVHHGRFSPPMPNFTMLAARTHPASRGKLWLQSADPLAPPHIDPAYFSDPEDLRYAKEGLRALLDIGAQQPFAANVQALNLPDRMPDDAALTEHIRRWSQTEYHTVGTCAMGTHENSVVDPLLRVRGIDSLRVIDASVMPTAISGNTNAAVIMIAEKGADLVKGHAQLVMHVRARAAETAAR